MVLDKAGLTRADKIALIEQGLMRAAEVIGDLNAPVMGEFYRRCPQALAAFEQHACGNRPRLEAEMMDNVLYCIMCWFERPEEIRILLFSSVPHHQETLKVDADWYAALLGAGVDIVAATVPPGVDDERAAWVEMRAGFVRAIDEARQVIMPAYAD